MAVVLVSFLSFNNRTLCAVIAYTVYGFFLFGS